MYQEQPRCDAACYLPVPIMAHTLVTFIEQVSPGFHYFISFPFSQLFFVEFQINSLASYFNGR